MKHITIISLLITLFSFDLAAQQPEIFSINGIAIKGYDVIAFFKSKAAVKGADSIAYEWKNTRWLFSTKANRDSFIADPERFSPCYGGYCAYGMSNGYKAPTETNTWTIINDKLYFNYNKKVQENWNKNRETFIKKADEQWVNVKTK